MSFTVKNIKDTESFNQSYLNSTESSPVNTSQGFFITNVFINQVLNQEIVTPLSSSTQQKVVLDLEVENAVNNINISYTAL